MCDPHPASVLATGQRTPYKDGLRSRFACGLAIYPQGSSMSFAANSVRSRLLATAIACAFALPAAVQAREGQAEFDRFIVRYKADSPERGNAAKRQQSLDVAGRGLGVAMGQQRRLALGADLVRTNRKLDRRAAEALMLRLRRDPNVEFVTLDTLKKP